MAYILALMLGLAGVVSCKGRNRDSSVSPEPTTSVVTSTTGVTSDGTPYTRVDRVDDNGGISITTYHHDEEG